MNISKLLKKYKYTSSPYIFYDDNMPAMYFTVLEDDKWHLYFTDNKEVQKVDFLQDMSIDNITCFKNSQTGLYCLSFCSKMNDTNSLFYAETKDPTEIKVFTTVTRNIRSGIITPKKIIYANMDNEIFCYNNNAQVITKIDNGNLDLIKEKYLFNFKNLKKISFLNGNQNQLIISYQDFQFAERRGSLFADLSNLKNQRQVLTQNNQSMMNITIDPFTNQVLYSEKEDLKEIHQKIVKTYLKNINSKQVSIIEKVKK